MALTFERSVVSKLSFAADPNDGGRFCNTDLSLTEQKLVSCDVEITDARTLDVAPALDQQGFVLAEHVLDNPDWYDEEWIDTVYMPSCVDLVKNLTGAPRAVAFFRPLKRIADPAKRGDNMYTAGFVHIDHPQKMGRMIAQYMASLAGETFEHARIYNVWKPITPPPQDRPLAVADRRTITPSQHVEGMTVTDQGDTPYVIVAPSESSRFYFFSNMDENESIVFVGVDLDPDNPLGCAHSAFDHPDGGNSRSSVEARVIAIFD